MLWRLRVVYWGLRTVLILLLARSLLALGFSGAAVALLQRDLRRAYPVHKPLVFLQLISMYERVGRVGDAIALLNEAIRAEPNQETAASYYLELALIHENAGDKDAAIANFERALALCTDSSEEFRADLRARIAQLKSP